MTNSEQQHTSTTVSAPKQILSQGWDSLVNWLTNKPHAVYALAVMRITYGLMTAFTLLLYIPQFSYTFGEASRWAKVRLGSQGNGFPWPLDSIFLRSDDDQTLFIKVAVLFLLALVYAAGYKTRITGPLFAIMWLSFSALNPLVTNSSHYPTFRVLLIFMLFAKVAEKWSVDAHLKQRKSQKNKRRKAFKLIPEWFSNLFSNAAVILIGFQIIIVYVMSSLWKTQGTMWFEGSALYYALRIDELALLPWLNDLAWHVSPFIIIGSWIGLFVQLLFPISLLNRYTKAIALILLVGMHIGIGIFLSLPLFSIMMIAADLIFIKDKHWETAIRWLKSPNKMQQVGQALKGKSRSTQHSGEENFAV